VTTTALQTINETTTNLKQITSMVQRPEGLENVSGKEEKMRVTRLTSDFQSSVQKFTDTQKQILSKMKTTTPPSTRAMMDSEDQNQSLVDSEAAQQAQAQQQQQAEFEQGLLLERENRIRQIETDILDVNDIMKELATLVHEQGTVVGKCFILNSNNTLFHYFIVIPIFLRFY
jgi:t-SNARE domain-containing protein 1